MGLFNWFKNRRKSAESALVEAPVIPTSSNLAFVLLSEPTMPEVSDLQIDFHQFAPAGQTLIEAVDDDDDSSDQDDSETQIITLEVTGVGTAFLALIPMSVPNGESEGARQHSIGAFRDKDIEPIAHKAHLVVTLMNSDTSPIDSLTTFTALLAAIVKASPSTEVYWGNAGATHDTEIFLSFAESGKEELASMIMIWNGISRAMEDDGRISFLSLGMNQLGLPDLYLIAPKDKYGEAFEMMWDLLIYVAERGQAIPAGDTVGESANHRLKVEYVPSPAGGDELVWKIEM